MHHFFACNKRKQDKKELVLGQSDTQCHSENKPYQNRPNPSQSRPHFNLFKKISGQLHKCKEWMDEDDWQDYCEEKGLGMGTF